MDAVDPEVNVAFGREITLAPTCMLARPGLLEPPDGRGREPAGILAEQCDQRLLEITLRQASLKKISHRSTIRVLVLRLNDRYGLRRCPRTCSQCDHTDCDDTKLTHVPSPIGSSIRW